MHQLRVRRRTRRSSRKHVRSACLPVRESCRWLNCWRNCRTISCCRSRFPWRMASRPRFERGKSSTRRRRCFEVALTSKQQIDFGGLDMARAVKLAVLGAGMIGKRHIEHVAADPEAELTAIVDPSPAGKAKAGEMNVRWASSFAALLEVDKPDGIIVATPNQLHVVNGLESIAAGIPALVEKPIADDVASGIRLVEAAETAGVPLLVGHHRRHNPMIQKAKEIIESGRLGQVLAVHGTCWLYKPD